MICEIDTIDGHLTNRAYSFCNLKAGVYFDEIAASGSGETTRYVPRSVQIDLEAGVCNRVCVTFCTTCPHH